MDGPDLTQGIDLADLRDGEITLGHVGDEAVVVTKQGGETFAVGATCTHYGASLAKGLVVGGTIRCPLHHACFSLRTGAALAAPALDPIPAWTTEERAGRLFVLEKRAPRRAVAYVVGRGLSHRRRRWGRGRARRRRDAAA